MKPLGPGIILPCTPWLPWRRECKTLPRLLQSVAGCLEGEREVVPIQGLPSDFSVLSTGGCSDASERDCGAVAAKATVILL